MEMAQGPEEVVKEVVEKAERKTEKHQGEDLSDVPTKRRRLNFLECDGDSDAVVDLFARQNFPQALHEMKCCRREVDIVKPACLFFGS